MLSQDGIALLLRHLVLHQVLFSHSVEIHCSYTVIVGAVTAFSALEPVVLLVSVAPFRMTAYGTSL